MGLWQDSKSWSGVNDGSRMLILLAARKQERKDPDAKYSLQEHISNGLRPPTKPHSLELYHLSIAMKLRIYPLIMSEPL